MTFDGATLVMDTIKGVRSFDVDKWGRLEGVTNNARWKPGWNTATHHGYNDPMWKGHETAGKGCSCGFYAYFKRADTEYDGDSKVMGIIEGKGRVSASTKGFRAEQARIIALSPAPNASGSFAWMLARLIMPPYSFLVFLFFVAWSVLGFKYDDDGWWGAPGIVLGILYTIGAGIVLVSEMIDREPIFQWRQTEPTQYQLLKRNYPEAKVFHTRTQMLRKMKTSQSPIAAEIYGPDSPDFWEEGK